MKNIFLILGCLISLNLLASNVGVVDSGTFFDHVKLQGRSWNNPKEIPNNNIDDDANKKIDDIVGWNFADSSGKVFFPEHISSIDPRVYKIFEILAKTQLGTATQEDKDFWNKNVANLPEDKKQQMLSHLNYYGQYAHSTHCSGIIALGNADAKIMSARIFPDGEPPVAPDPQITPVEDKNPLYVFVAYMVNRTFIEVSDYLKETSMEVANYSIGVSLSALAKQLIGMGGNENPTEEEIAAETQKLYESFEPIGKGWIQNSPNTLFVIAAGNDKSDNDKLPTFPANLNVENAITVAATKNNIELASFSNYGKTTVHVAAPGVAIMSTVPDPTKALMLPLSGTSMAAPYVTMVASLIKDNNPKLTPIEVKKIIMDTVDKKDWLKDKVISEGIVNLERAVKAASLSNSLAVSDAIAIANKEIPNIKTVSPRKGKSIPLGTKEMKDWANKLVF